MSVGGWPRKTRIHSRYRAHHGRTSHRGKKHCVKRHWARKRRGGGSYAH